METNIRITGEAGQGVQTVGDLITRAFAEMGLHVFTTQSYMSRIRGGVNSTDIRISNAELFSAREDCDLLVALNEESASFHIGSVSPGGAVISTTDMAAEGAKALKIDFDSEARLSGGSNRMGNSVAAGAVFAAIGADISFLEKVFESHFTTHGGGRIAEANIACARAGARIASNMKKTIKFPALDPAAFPFVISGSEIIALSALISGVKVVSSYPMTPSTGVFTELASLADEFGAVVEQAEDEIAAINIVCGAA
ncbi:MAG TPA: 2-oxoacid:acceptor oxidoreductase family protein, partial [bacterium]|nr:2-oxoacid:acceptor oxidoreductase family protein [bacterium]